MKISNAFETQTAKGKHVYRIRIDNNEILSNLEQGNTIMAIDIITYNGNPKVTFGTTKAGKQFKTLHYYVWAKKPNEQFVQPPAPVIP